MFIKKILLKDIIKEITLHKKRFLSILLIIMIGFGFSLGLDYSATNMTKTIKDYYQKNNLFDIKIESLTGFTKNSVLSLKEINSIDDISLSKSINSVITINNKDYNIKVNSIDNKNKINKLTLTSGRYPAAINEGVVQEDFLNDCNLQIGDLITLKIKNNYDLKAKKIKIVGTVRSSYYFSKDNIDDIENKKIDYYLYLQENNFNIDYYTTGFIRLKDSNKYDTYQKKYDDYLSKYTDKIKSIVTSNMKFVNDENTLKIENEIKDLEYDLKRLNQTDLPVNSLNDSIKEITIKISNKKRELETVKNYDLKVIKRTELKAFNEYKENANNFKTISKICSISILLITIISVLFIIFKMIDKNKHELMILESFGYHKLSFFIKYLFYAFLSSLIAVTLGAVLFPKIITLLISWCLTKAYDIPIFISKFNINYALLLGIIIIFIIMIATTLFLIRICKKASFNKAIIKTNKSVIIIIITLLMALILFTFKIKSSFIKTVSKEYEKINKYEMIIDLKNEVNQDNHVIIQNELLKNKKINKIMFISKLSIKVNSKNVNLIIPNDANGFNNFVTLKNNIKTIKLNNDGVILTKNIAKELNIKKNEKIKITLPNNKIIKVKVYDITKNYINDFIYMAPYTYKKLTDDKINYNTIFVKASKKIDDVKADLINMDNVDNITLTKQLKDNYKNKIKFINNYIIVLIIIGLLFGYIAISILIEFILGEEKTKLQTIKNIGFSDNEVLKNISKKIIFPFAFIIIASDVIGNLLTILMISNYKLNNTFLSFNISIISYLITLLIITTLSFTIIFKIHNKLKKN